MTAGPYRRNPAQLAAAQQLTEAMMQHKPACVGDERFTSDAARDDARAEADMLAACESCPLLTACDRYADQTRPTAGYWAGRWRGQLARGQYLARGRRAKADPSPGARAADREALTGDHFPEREEGKGQKP